VTLVVDFPEQQGWTGMRHEFEKLSFAGAGNSMRYASEDPCYEFRKYKQIFVDPKLMRSGGSSTASAGAGAGGGGSATSAADMRAARLARLGGAPAAAAESEAGT